MSPELQTVLTVSVPTLAVLIGILVNNSRLTDLNNSLNARINDLRADVNSSLNARINDLRAHMDQRFDDLKELIEVRLSHLEERIR
jgi:hypothetical protein